MSRIQSLKAANTTRVDLQQARRFADERLLLGGSTENGFGSYCGAGWHDLGFDVYHRPVTQSTLKMDSPACNGGGMHSASSRISTENLERPYTASCAPGFRGGDTLGVGRDHIPVGIYDGTTRGAFVRHYAGNENKAGPAPECDCCSAYAQRPSRYDGSHDATHREWRG